MTSNDNGLLSRLRAASPLAQLRGRKSLLTRPTCPRSQLGLVPFCREVVERRTYTVTGQKASPEEIDRLIETGESEQIFQKAILEQGRGHVRLPSPSQNGNLHEAAPQGRSVA